MEPSAIYALASVFGISLISLFGVFILSRNSRAGFVSFLVALAAGTFLGDAFFHLIPDAFDGAIPHEHVGLLIVSGIVLFFLLEKVLHWHHHAAPKDPCEDDANHRHAGIRPVGKLVLAGDGIHNFIDGLLIGASYLAHVPLGVATTIAVLLHEIPQEVGDFGVLVRSGFSRKRALLFNFLSGITAIIGVVLIITVGARLETLVQFLIPFTAGIFIYIATADLVPELHKTKGGKGSVRDFLAFFVGIFSMYLLLYLE